jgi:ribonucleoside-diphosphate reductase alpha chain
MASVAQPDRLTENSVDIEFQGASLDIWDQKYRLKDGQGNPVDEDINATYQRVARTLAEVEAEELRPQWEERFIWALQRGAIPAGRIISNAGAQAYKPSTSTINCTVSGAVPDSMEGILQRNLEAGLTLKAGCGIGYEFSTLRPRGAYVSGAGAYTSGPLSFMDIYDKMCFTVSSAGGRRGAQMATFDVSHPDVFDFVRAKREDGRLRQFNLSLLITDDFIQAVRDDEEWPLSFPLREKERDDLGPEDEILWREFPISEGYITNDLGLVACKVYKRIRASKLWNAIMASTYDYAEPGFILIDKVNPCVTGDTWVQTTEGPRQVAELLGRPFSALVDGSEHRTGPEGFFKTADKPVVRMSTRAGHALRLTSDHRVRRVSKMTRWAVETQWCEAGQLEAGDKVLLNNHRGNTCWPGQYNFDQGYLMGLLVGDGTLKQDAAVLSVWRPAAQVNEPVAGDGVDGIMAAALAAARTLPHRSDFCGWSPVAGRDEYRLKLAAVRDLALELGMTPGNKVLTPAVERGSSDFCRGLLRGLFDADGSVQGTQQKGVSVRLAQSDLPCLESVQRMLLRLGIGATIYCNRRDSGTKLLPDGKGGSALYSVREQHELVISGDNLLEFAEQIGFADTQKQAHLQDLLRNYRRSANRERFVVEVAAVEEDGFEAVYDVQVPGINTFDANGIHAHNCGEQPLPPYGSCLLGSVNLTRFVRKPFTEEAYFDWEEYREVVTVFTRMLDNVVEINGLPLEGQREEIKAKRRHGMGFLGLGSTLAMLRMKYGEADSVAFTEQVSRDMAVAGWREGLELAREKGAAPVMAQEFEVTAEMLRRRPELAENGVKEGDKLPGRELLARYSRYMQALAEQEPELVEAIAREGSRFTHHSSIAPTGTISLSLANNASNGIEPSFAHHYSRNVIRQGKKSKEKMDVFSYELLAYRELVNAKAMPGSEKEGELLPDYFVSSETIDPTQHVDIQAAAQKWVDSSISKTINVPTDLAYETFKDVYLYAAEQGLKGCTTFRFNPEAFQGVLVKEKDLENTCYEFTLDDGTTVEFKGNEEVEYDGELHTAANLFDALKEGYYGKF